MTHIIDWGRGLGEGQRVRQSLEMKAVVQKEARIASRNMKFLPATLNGLHRLAKGGTQV